MADVIDVAYKHLGERGTVFWDYCGNQGQAWCAAFISTILAEAGEGDAISNKRMTSVLQYRDYFIEKNAYKTKGTYTPQVGDVVIMKTDSGAMGSHVALVTKVYPDGSFDTIEGNRGGKKALGNTVVTDHYTGNEDYISGYGIPQYQNPPVGGGDYSSIGNNGVSGNGSSFGGNTMGGTGGLATGVGVYEFEEYTPQPGDTWQSIADKFGVELAELLSYNNATIADDPLSFSPLKVPKPPLFSQEVAASGAVNAVQKAHVKSVKVYHPVIKAEFFAETGMETATEKVAEDTVWGDYDMDFDIISCNTQRSLSADCASMSITLTNRRDWYNILKPNDLVIVRMQRPEFGEDAEELHEEEQEVFIGVIDDIRKSLDFSSGQPRRAVQVTARGMGKAFVNFDVGLIENITATGSAEQGWMDFASMTDMNSADAIGHVWKQFVGNGIQYEFANGTALQSYVRYDGTSKREEEKMLDHMSYTQYSGSLWNFIKEISNTPFNETFWEIRDGKSVLCHRKTPFNPEEWNALPRRVIHDDDIVTDSTGRSDLETYTVFIVNMRFVTQNVKNLHNPLWYYPYYKKYGLSQLEVTSTYECDTGQLGEAMQIYCTDLFNWNIKNNRFANGQLVVKGRASYKIGDVVVLEYCNMEFYVEGVSHSFTVYGGWTTTLSLTRGIRPEDRFTSPWGAAQEMTKYDMTKIIQITGGNEVDFTEVSMEDTSFDLPGAVQSVAGTVGNVMNLITGGQTGLSGYNGAPLAGGQTTQIPSSYQGSRQSGIVGDATPFLREKWSYGMGQVQAAWEKKGSTHNGHFCTYDGYYMVACVESLGKCGDVIQVNLEDGSHINCLVTDNKKLTDANSTPYGHKFEDGTLSVIEFETMYKSGAEVDTQQLKKELTQLGYYGKKVVSVTNCGSYLNVQS